MFDVPRPQAAAPDITPAIAPADAPAAAPEPEPRSEQPIEPQAGPLETVAAPEAPPSAEPEATAAPAIDPPPAEDQAASDVATPIIYRTGDAASRVTLRARTSAWVHVSSTNNDYLWVKTLRPGDTFVVPDRPTSCCGPAMPAGSR